MTDRQLLEKILEEQQAMRKDQAELRADVGGLKTDVGGVKADVKNVDLKVELVNKRVAETAQHLSNKIDEAQEDTIDALKDLLLSPLDSHEERITVLEEEVGLKPRKH